MSKANKTQQINMNEVNKIKNPINYGKQQITDEDIQAVTEVLKSDYLTQGPKVKEFEEKFADYIGSDYAVALANGTAALHLSAMTLNIKPGDKVLTTPITFAASANCVLYCGGEIDFVDIDPETYLMDLNKLEEKLQNSKAGEYKGVIPVDFAGHPVNLEKLKKIAEKYKLWILEDACHAPGGYFVDSKGQKQYCGNGNFADLAIFSFHPVKHIATGEGGMITTNNKELYEKLMLLRTHGITKNTELFQNSTEIALGTQSITTNNGRRPNDYPSWYYEMQELGYNYRLSDIQAALGTSQLKRAESGLKRRNEIAENYNEAFKNLDIITPNVNINYYNAYHLYVIQTKKRKELYNYLRENKIFAQVHYIPVHLQPFYKNKGFKKGNFPVAEKYYENCLSLPMFPSLTNEEQDYVIECVMRLNE